jgi:hypothetical protein
MADWITGPTPYETPLDAAQPDYEKLKPSFMDSMGALYSEGSATLGIMRAGQRGASPGSSTVDQAIASPQGAPDLMGGYVPSDLNSFATPPPAQQKANLIPADEANKKYAPPGTKIADKPIDESLAQTLGQQKAAQIEREGVLKRYSENASLPARLGMGVAAFIMDPLNAATAMVPGVGEEAIAAKFGYATAREAPLLARVGIRAAAGATAGVAAQAPLSALKFGFSQEEDGDYDIRSAMSDMAFSGMLGAAAHAGIVGPLSDMLHARKVGRIPPDPTLSAPPQVRHEATGVGVSQLLDGRPLDVEPVLDESGQRSTAAALELRQRYAGIGVTPEDTTARAMQDIAGYRYATSSQSRSLYQEMKELGGLKLKNADGSATEGPDVQGALEDVKNKPPGLVNNKSGLTPERMHEALQERGWFGHGTVDDEALVQAIQRQAGGERVLHPNDEAAYPAAQRSQIEGELTAAGVGPGDDLATAAKKLGDWRSEQAFTELKTRADALGVPHHALTTSEDLLGDVLEREAIQHEPLTPAELAQRQETLYRNGYAPGIPQDEFDRANEAIYGPKDEEAAAKAGPKPKPEPAEGGEGLAARPVSAAETDLAELERQWEQLNRRGYQTAKGSAYELHEDGTTTRTKAAREDVGHEGDAGLKPQSERTVYVETPEQAMALSAAGVQGLGDKGARLVIKDGMASLATWNERAGKWGISPSSRNIPISTEPGIGKSPLEMWKPADDVPGHEAYSNMHAGNPIVSISDGAGKLLPEEAAELRSTEAAVSKANAQADGLEQAASCLRSAGV